VVDGNGNITDYVDTNGTVVAHYEFDAFGNTVAQSGTPAEAFANRFSSKYFDAETGLYYYGYRYFSTELGRWITRDPLGFGIRALKITDLLNLTRFVGNDPVAHVDPIGLLRYEKEYNECSKLRKKWKDKGKYPDPIVSGSAEEWWNKYVDNAKKCPIKLDCLDCCPEQTHPGYTMPPRPFHNCEIKICAQRANEVGSDMLRLFVHEMTHCQQYGEGQDADDNKNCDSCLCSEIQACAKEAAGLSDDAIIGCARESCKKQCVLVEGRAPGTGSPWWYPERRPGWLNHCRNTGRLP
jgi:RHS repeat-associated protein